MGGVKKCAMCLYGGAFLSPVVYLAIRTYPSWLPTLEIFGKIWGGLAVSAIAMTVVIELVFGSRRTETERQIAYSYLIGGCILNFISIFLEIAYFSGHNP